MFTSVDGLITGPGGTFVGPARSADLDAWTADMVERFDTLVYGCRAWQEMAAFWPGAATDGSVTPAQRELARFMNGSRKIVHHRGQLSVYLRLLGMPVPGLYGPSADERP